MNESRNPKHPPDSLLGPRARSAVLYALICSLVVFFALVGVALLFWNVAHPRLSAVQQERERVIGTSSDYSTEGGHNPVRHPSSTRDELKFRGALTPPPNEARSR